MTKFNTCVLRYFFFHLNVARTWMVSAFWCRRSKDKCIDFCYCTSTKSNQSLTSFIHHVIKDTSKIQYFNPRLNNQDDPLLSEMQFSMPTRDHNGSCQRCVTRCYATQWRNRALADINEWFGTGLFRFPDNCHWLLLLIHINECVNIIQRYSIFYTT